MNFWIVSDPEVEDQLNMSYDIILLFYLFFVTGKPGSIREIHNKRRT